ncbi:MAG: hydrogen peroxide-inducible genes activator [Candidatus Krumholzibacteriota bacterium]
MTLQELKYVVAVADHLHFGRAAAACHVTQPTLSAGIANLEEELGWEIFERGSRLVMVADGAEHFIAQSRRVLTEASALDDLAHRSRPPLTGTFRLGAIPTVGPYVFPHVIGSLRAAHPDLVLHLKEEKTDDLVAALRNGSLDAALLSPPLAVSGLEEMKLYREDFHLALPAGHALGRKRRVKLADLRDEALLLLDEGHCLRDQVVEFCSLPTNPVRELLRSSSLETLRSMVAAGVGCTLLPALAIGVVEGLSDQILIRSFSGRIPHREVCLYWRKGFTRRESARLLGEIVGHHLPPAVSPLVFEV